MICEAWKYLRTYVPRRRRKIVTLDLDLVLLSLDLLCEYSIFILVFFLAGPMT